MRDTSVFRSALAEVDRRGFTSRGDAHPAGWLR
jgi:hypothetical protein